MTECFHFRTKIVLAQACISMALSFMPLMSFLSSWAINTYITFHYACRHFRYCALTRDTIICGNTFHIHIAATLIWAFNTLLYFRLPHFALCWELPIVFPFIIHRKMPFNVRLFQSMYILRLSFHHINLRIEYFCQCYFIRYIRYYQYVWRPHAMKWPIFRGFVPKIFYHRHYWRPILYWVIRWILGI